MVHSGVLYISGRQWGPLNVAGPEVANLRTPSFRQAWTLYPVYTIEQTSSKYQAITYVCWTIHSSSQLHHVYGVLHTCFS